MVIEDTSITIMVESGSSLTRVANELEKRDLIGSSRNLTLYARIQGTADLIQTGEYELTVGMTPMEFLKKITTGDTRQYRVTLIEGCTLDQALNEIWSNSKISRNCFSVKRYKIWKKYYYSPLCCDWQKS